MILFLDTEFTDYTPAARLLSLALVSQDGQREFYAERNDVPDSLSSDFAREYILPQFGRYPDAVCNIKELRVRLWSFLAAIPEVLFAATDAQIDYDFLMYAMGPIRQSRFCPKLTRLKGRLMWPEWIDAEEYYFSGRARHHALEDARALRHGYTTWYRAAKGWKL